MKRFNLRPGWSVLLLTWGIMGSILGVCLLIFLHAAGCQNFLQATLQPSLWILNQLGFPSGPGTNLLILGGQFALGGFLLGAGIRGIGLRD
jgi:hypothetical protein